MFVMMARHFRTENRSLYGINEDSSTKITRPAREKWISGGARNMARLQPPAWLQRWRAHLEQRVERWRRKHHPPQLGHVEVKNNRVYILPTKTGVGYLVLLVALLAGSINYNNSLGYSLTFLLASLFLTSMIYSFRNLAGVQWEIKPATPIFVGEVAGFPVVINNPSKLPRCTLIVRGSDKQEQIFPDIAPSAQQDVILSTLGQRRGILQAHRASLYTEFPLGLFHAWTWIEGAATTLVYPAPEPHTATPHTTSAFEAGPNMGAGDYDFHDLRPYQRGESLRHVAWKAYARDQGLFTKIFAGQAPAQQWLTWEATTGLATEARLSRLCRWILQAEAQGHNYGLRLPDTELPPSRGDVHLHRCLSALARFPGGENA
jgi:uncharacterized protein (DUF58 family)